MLIDNVYGGDKGFNLEFKSYFPSTISGYTIDSETNRPIKVSLEVEDVSNGEIVAKAESDSLTGHFHIDFKKENPEKEYRLITKSKGYFFSETTIETE